MCREILLFVDRLIALKRNDSSLRDDLFEFINRPWFKEWGISNSSDVVN